jgi:hypothetical protein
LRKYFSKIDGFCGRMNGALAAVAVALAVVVYATALVRTPNLISTKQTQHINYGTKLASGGDARPGF